MTRYIKYLFILILIMFLTGCNQNTYSKDFFYMDTSINVKLYNITKERSEEIFVDINNILKEYHNLTDRYNQYQEVNVYHLNNVLKVNKKIKIDSKLYNIIQYGINAYESTNGKVNIAIGNAVDLWRRSEQKQSLPTKEQLKQDENNINNIILEEGCFMKTDEIKLDLGSYVKGYVTELISDFLLEKNIKSYIINSGGNVRVGQKNSNDSFTVGIENPDNSGDIIEIVKGNNISVVTSGSYERFYNINGNRYSHIIDSRTLFPSNNMKSVTVVTDDSGKADILSTYLYQLTVEEALNYANNIDSIEIFIIDNNNNKYYSKGFNYE